MNAPSSPRLSRRTIAKGAAWGAPAVALASAAPAASASVPVGTSQLSYVWELVTDTHDVNNPTTSYCTAPQVTLTNTGTDGATITIDKVAAWNDSLQKYTFPMTALGAPLISGASLPIGGDGAGTLDPGQDYYVVIKWTDASGVTTTTVSCPIQSQHAACGYAGGTDTGTSSVQPCTLPTSLPAGW